MAVAIHTGAVGSEYHGNQKMGSKPVGRKHIFVQTDTGSVLGIELERGDNVHTVKRKMQLALHVPTEGSNLTFGDLVLKNDLSVVRNNSALRLTKNVLQKSSSTPCLSPSSNNLQHRDPSGPIEILCFSDICSRTKQLVKDVVKAIKGGMDPIPVRSGLGGAYYFRNTVGENVAIVKPTDEEPFAPNNPKGFVGKVLGQPGLKKSVRVGETGSREVAAYLLDYDNFANVPPTVLVKITHSVFCINEGVNSIRSRNGKKVSKIASFQEFVPHDSDARDLGTSSFPVSSVHRIGILDIRTLNTDRHSGNILVRKLDKVGMFGELELIPIDHGMCLPEDLEDPYFEWLYWPQASIPFSDAELEYIANLDPFKDAELLRSELPMLREACLRVLILCTIFLKDAAAFGLCLAEIGAMMSHNLHGLEEEEPSELELVCIEARNLVAEQGTFSDDFQDEETEDGDYDQFQFHIDCDEYPDQRKQLRVDCHSRAFVGFSFPPNAANFGPKNFHALSFPSPKGGNCSTPLSKLDESLEFDDDDDELESIEEEPAVLASAQKGDVCKLSQSFKCMGIGDRYRRHGSTSSGGPMAAGIRRSAEEQVQVAPSFVKLSNMSLEEWGAFLHKFQELLQVAFEARKQRNISPRRRLGTSCQF